MSDLVLEITDTAKEDMENIFSFIAKDNEHAARELVNNFYEVFSILLLFPKSGFTIKKYVKYNVRIYVTAKHYKIFYYVKNNQLFIQRVLTGYQDVL